MAKYIDVDKSYDTATLTDWYINSVMDEPPVWTEEHLEELLNDFYVIPKDTPAADVVEVVNCKDCKHYIAGFCTRDINGRTNMFRMSENDYCSYGERKGND